MTDLLDGLCPATPLRRRWWQRRARHGAHDLMVRWSSPTTSYQQVTPIASSGMLLALDAAARKPRCVIFCAGCGVDQINAQAPIATAMYALHDGGHPVLARMLGAAYASPDGHASAPLSSLLADPDDGPNPIPWHAPSPLMEFRMGAAPRPVPALHRTIGQAALDAYGQSAPGDGAFPATVMCECGCLGAEHGTLWVGGTFSGTRCDLHGGHKFTPAGALPPDAPTNEEK